MRELLPNKEIPNALCSAADCCSRLCELAVIASTGAVQMYRCAGEGHEGKLRRIALIATSLEADP